MLSSSSAITVHPTPLNWLHLSVIDETTLPDDARTQETMILDEDETYHFYQCLHTLFHPTATSE
jgi:hypothetical protein